MSGNKGGNTNISEFLSIILEPIASEQKESMEVNSTDGFLAAIVKINEENSTPVEGEHESTSSHQGYIEGSNDEAKCQEKQLAYDQTILNGWKENETCTPNKHIHGAEEHPPKKMTTSDQRSEVRRIDPNSSNLVEDNDDETTYLSSPLEQCDQEVKDSKNNDISFYIKEDVRSKSKTLHLDGETGERHSNPQKDCEKRKSKTHMIRRKMKEARIKQSQQAIKDAMIVRKSDRVGKTWKGKKLISAKDVKPEEIQDKLEMVIVGADVQAVYPSLLDIEVALICYMAVVKSNVKFENL